MISRLICGLMVSALQRRAAETNWLRPCRGRVYVLLLKDDAVRKAADAGMATREGVALCSWERRMQTSTRNRGFASMDREKQREIARKGGRAAHEKGTAHEFTTDEARAAGRKGGERVSVDRDHMSRIGRLGGKHSAGRRQSVRHTGTESSYPSAPPENPEAQTAPHAAQAG